MRLDRALRLSSYLTLGLACACLGYAELVFLPELTWFLTPLTILFVLAFLLEGRWVLPVWAANVVGLVITCGSLGWVVHVYRLRLKGLDFSGGSIPWPAGLLPHVGPLLMLLLLVKLFRPKRHNDYWLLHTIGFLQVALACVLAGDAWFGLVFFAYLACALWCLTLLQLAGARELVASEPASGGSVPSTSGKRPTPGPDRVPWRLGGVGQAGRWAVAVGVLGLVLFLAAPRQAGMIWDSNSLASGRGLGQPETGFRGEIDLNTTGTLEVSTEPAFEVTVTDTRGRPKEDLSPDQRWRGVTLDIYDEGHWNIFLPMSVSMELGLDSGLAVPPPPHLLPQNLPRRLHRNQELPHFGKDQYFLTFIIDRKRSTGLFLADPIRLGPGATDHPYQVRKRLQRRLPFQLFFESDGTLIRLPRLPRGLYVYTQVATPPPPGQDPLTVPRWLMDPTFRRFRFGHRPLPQIRHWTRALLGRLARRGRYGLTVPHLQPGARGSAVQVRHRRAIAQALCRYLATSGEFTYSLKLRRSDRKLDPTLDFLVNVRQGHCNRFAGALALMLRALDIPARLVTGYRGAEHLGQGHYVVRQNQAHSWVEVLVPAQELDGRLAWLTLDPTPAAEAEEEGGFNLTAFLTECLVAGEMWWKAFIVNFDPDRQHEAVQALGQRLVNLGGWIGACFSGRFWAKPGFWALLGSGVLLGCWFSRRFRPGRRPAAAGPHASSVGFYARLLGLLGRRCRLQPQTGQTPREFGQTVRRLLEAVPAAANLAELPARVTDLFYQVRFGGRVLPAAECQELDRQLDQLDRTLGDCHLVLKENAPRRA